MRAILSTVFIIPVLFSWHCSKAFPGSDFLPFAALVAGIDTAESDPDGFTIGGSAAGLNGSVDLTNQGETITVSADGDFVFNTRYVSTSTYNVTASNATNNMQCSVNNASGTVAQANVTDVSIVCTSEYDPAGAPSVVSSNPQPGATKVAVCSGTTCRARVYLYFDQSMDSSLTPTLTATINSTATTVSVSNHNWFNSSYVDDSLEVELSWVHFPVNTTPTLTFNQAQLLDKGGTSITANYSISFTTGDGHYYALADSGLSNTADCTNGAAFIGCPHTQFGQDADYLRTARSFTGPTMHATYTADYTTTDNVTGLVWTTCPRGLSDPACGTGAATTHTWYAAVDECANLNAANAGAGYAGQTDWRLPSMRELRSIINYSGTPAIDTANFTAIPATGNYWSATTLTASATIGLGYAVNTGLQISGAKTGTAFVRCVRGTGTAQASYTDNNDETVTDNVTGLVWMRCLRGLSGLASGTNCGTGAVTSLARDAAIADCEGLTWGGRSDWRLPSITEYNSILDDTRRNPPHDTTYFPTLGTVLNTSTPDRPGGLPANLLTVDTSAVGNTNSLSVALNYRCVAN